MEKHVKDRLKTKSKIEKEVETVKPTVINCDVHDSNTRNADLRTDAVNAKCFVQPDGSKYGMTPCSSNAGSGYIAGSGACDAQCYTGDGGARTDCRARPSGAVAATSMGNVLDEASDAIRNASWRVWALLLPWVIVALLIVAYFVQFIFPRNPCCPARLAAWPGLLPSWAKGEMHRGLLRVRRAGRFRRCVRAVPLFAHRLLRSGRRLRLAPDAVHQCRSRWWPLPALVCGGPRPLL